MREDPEIVRRQSDAPRRVQEIAVLQAEKELSIGIEDGDIAEAWAVLFVVARRFFLSKGHDQIAAHILDVEWRVTSRNPAIVKRSRRKGNRFEETVEHINCAGLEIRRV